MTEHGKVEKAVQLHNRIKLGLKSHQQVIIEPVSGRQVQPVHGLDLCFTFQILRIK